MSALELQVPDEFVDAIARRVVELLRDNEAPAGVQANALLTVDEAAEYLRARRERVYQLVHQGRIDVERDGRRVLVRRGTLDAYLRGAS